MTVDPGHLEIRQEASEQDRRAALRIRAVVFVEEQRIPRALDEDGKDDRSVHVLAFRDGQAVATARLSVEGDGTGVISRVAVLPAYRGSGLGGRLVSALEVLAREQQLTAVTLEPHEHLEAFYGRLGFERVAGTHVAGEHKLITMRKRL